MTEQGPFSDHQAQHCATFFKRAAGKYFGSVVMQSAEIARLAKPTETSPVDLGRAILNTRAQLDNIKIVGEARHKPSTTGRAPQTLSEAEVREFVIATFNSAQRLSVVEGHRLQRFLERYPTRPGGDKTKAWEDKMRRKARRMALWARIRNRRENPALVRDSKRRLLSSQDSV